MPMIQVAEGPHREEHNGTGHQVWIGPSLVGPTASFRNPPRITVGSPQVGDPPSMVELEMVDDISQCCTLMEIEIHIVAETKMKEVTETRKGNVKIEAG